VSISGIRGLCYRVDDHNTEAIIYQEFCVDKSWEVVYLDNAKFAAN